jgi:hypothetical protein
MSGKNQIDGGAFQDFEGNVLAFGFLTMQLSHDEQESVQPGQVFAAYPITVPLDANGNIAGTVYVWPNDQLNPANSYYIVNAYRADGTLAWLAPQYETVTTLPSPFNVGTWIPNNPPGGGAQVGSILLQTNGVNNGDQAKLNLHSSDSSVTLTDDGTGDINLQAAGGGSAGENVFAIPQFNDEDGGIANFTMVMKMPAALIQATGSSVIVSILSGSNLGGTGFEMSGASIGATLPSYCGPGVISPNLAWTTAPVTLTFPSIAATSTLYSSNAAAITIDTAHDYYITLYLTGGNTSNIPFVNFSSAVPLQWASCFGYVSGNHTNDADASQIQTPSGSGNLHLFAQVKIG